MSVKKVVKCIPLATNRPVEADTRFKRRVYIAGSLSEPERYMDVVNALRDQNVEIVVSMAQQKSLLELDLEAIATIKAADDVFLLTKSDNSLGESTLFQKAIAISEGKNVYDVLILYEEEPDDAPVPVEEAQHHCCDKCDE